MDTPENISTATELFNKNNYQADSLDDEIRADQFCRNLLQIFHQHLLKEQNLEALEAGSLAAGADYFLRDFMISNQRKNIFDCSATLVRRFAGHWYIISNLEPNMAELMPILKGTERFYHYCLNNKMMAAETAEEIRRVCSDYDYYQQRIESFHNITGDGYSDWGNACPLK